MCNGILTFISFITHLSLSKMPAFLQQEQHKGQPNTAFTKTFKTSHMFKQYSS